jgi:DNA (cytosine-5)-methyltransferase 1
MHVAWTSLRAADIGAPHGRERLFILAYHPEGSRWGVRDTPNIRAANREVNAPRDDCDPAADDAGDGRHERRPQPARLIRRSDAAISSAGHVDLLPTPTGRDHKGHNQRGDDTCLTGALLPTPTAERYGSNQSPSPGAAIRYGLDSIDKLLPTSQSRDASGGKKALNRERGFSPNLNDVAAHNQVWGKYAAAVHRWETLTRPAPSPTEPNTNGNPRLSATFAEWMMGWPAGWVTDIDISRNDQLRIIGNGVVPQQATAALRYLLTIAAAA